MSSYANVRSKILSGLNISSQEAKIFFEDLYKISQKRIAEEVGPDFGSYFPTNQYRGPGGKNPQANGWKYGYPLGVCDHFTASDSHRSALKWFSSYDKWDMGKGKHSASNASASFIIALNGEPFCLIDFWNGKADWHEPALNGLCVGIEHVNCGELRERDGKFYWWAKNWKSLYPYTASLPPQKVDFRGAKWMQPYTKEQILTNIVIKKAMLALYNYKGSTSYLRSDLFVDHSMYRDDKFDCGPAWPLAEIRNAVFSRTPPGEFAFVTDSVDSSSFQVVDTMDMKNLQRTFSLEYMPVLHDTFPTKESQILGIQLALKSLGYIIRTDGEYTDDYTNAVKKFQKSQGLTADGIPGPKTRTKIAELLKAKE